MSKERPVGLALGALPGSDKGHLFLLRGRAQPEGEEKPLCERSWGPSWGGTAASRKQKWDDASVASLTVVLCNACNSIASSKHALLEIKLARGLGATGREAKKRKSKRNEGPPTQTEAAMSIAQVAKAKRAEVLGAFRRLGPSTCDEIARALGWVHQSTSPRVHELAKAGALVDTGEKRKIPRSGRKAIVYAVAESSPATREVISEDPRAKQLELRR